MRPYLDVIIYITSSSTPALNESAGDQLVDTQRRTRSTLHVNLTARKRGSDTTRHNADQAHRICVSAIYPTSRSRRLGKTDAKMLEAVGKPTDCDTVTANVTVTCECQLDCGERLAGAQRGQCTVLPFSTNVTILTLTTTTRLPWTSAWRSCTLIRRVAPQL